MKIAILYICTGKYDVFWKDFYESCEQYFLQGCQRTYFVFTDAAQLVGEADNPAIKRIYQERLGWPNDTLLRFHLFDTVSKELAGFDYVFFFNANAKFVQPVTPSEVLPTEEEELVAVKHPGYYNAHPLKFTYESKQRRSTAFIPKGKGQYYFAGGVNGGTASAYLRLISSLKENIDRDRAQGIVAVWHDESHLNHYLLNRRIKVLSPAYVYPEGWQLPFEPVILIRDKQRLGGHDFLRDVTKRKPLRKKIAAFVKKILGR